MAAMSNEKKDVPKACKTTSCSRQCQAIICLILLLALLSLTACGYFFWLYQQGKLGASATLINEVTELGQALADLQSSTNARFATHKEQLQALRAATQPQAADEIFVNQLIDAAAVQAVLMHDYASSSALLQRAQTLLVHLDNATLLSEVESTLKAIKHDNYYEPLPALLTLEEMVMHINALPLKVAIPQKKTKPTQDNWLSLLKNNVSKLEKIVVIRRHEHSLYPLLTTDEKVGLDQNIRVNLAAAKWGLLQRCDELWHFHLSALINLLTHFYNTQDKTVISWLSQLKALNATTINKPPAFLLERITKKPEPKAVLQ